MDNDLAYHDHNWGRFRWGDDFGWTGAPILPAEPGDPWSMVFLQTTDRSRLRCLSQALYVWHHDEPAAIFRARGGADALGRPARPRRRLHPAGPDAAAARTARCPVCRNGSISPRHGPATRCTSSSARDSYARLAQPSEVYLDRSTRALRNWRYRPGERLDQRRGLRLRRHWCIRVAPWLNGFRRYCGARSSTWRTRCPTVTALLVAELGPMVVELDVDGEVFSLRGGDRLRGVATVRRAWPVSGSSPRELPSSIVLDARAGLGEAVETGRSRCTVRSTTSQRAHDSLLAYVHAAVRAPSAARAAGRTARRGRAMTRTRSRRRHPATDVPRSRCSGAGIAGLTAAHELVERGFVVTVYEPRTG